MSDRKTVKIQSAAPKVALRLSQPTGQGEGYQQYGNKVIVSPGDNEVDAGFWKAWATQNKDTDLFKAFTVVEDKHGDEDGSPEGSGAGGQGRGGPDDTYRSGQ